ncbi:phosphonate C-P lyase system protein PhnH [Halodurantibacterium flavum]|uniref:Phosphonate C-P lyase system protein PhnH n=1 Tax=Halodurantibacterium flavum TaxID=1382802 RepID=A0ABW4S103_9RHOB
MLSPDLTPAPQETRVAPPEMSREEARDTATYEALLWAFARPGLVRDLPVVPDAPAEPAMALILAALIDRECRVMTDDPVLAAQARQAGAAIVPAPEADHAFVAGDAALRVLPDLPTGSALYPDAGATLVIAAPIGRGRELRLQGPGVEPGGVTLRLGLAPGFVAARARAIRYPAGIDILVVEGRRVVALPRSTLLEEI